MVLVGAVLLMPAWQVRSRKLGQLMDVAGIGPSALTPVVADQLARAVPPGPESKIASITLPGVSPTL